MKSIGYLVLAVLMTASATAAAADGLLERSFRPLTGKTPVELSQAYGGQVLLIVNTASKCGLAPQFEGLESLHSRY
jgi:glutathione peroxidase